MLEKVIDDFPKFDARLLVEEYDPLISALEGKTGNELGPNPKIRNVSRAYREAKEGSLIWVIDCNVWISKGVAGRMVDRLMGYLPDGKRVKPYKFVHQLPLVVDITTDVTLETEATGENTTFSVANARGGGRLEEMFMATTHAKFYNAINTVGVAPCTLGKSNMFRKSHLDKYTNPAHNTNLSTSDASRGRGIDFFSGYICEDHLIGDLLWNANIPGHRNHGLVLGDLAIQPMADMSVYAYWSRRVRWLRVRKWTVLVATLVEPGVESLLCNAYFSYAITTLPWFNKTFGIPQTWIAAFGLWLAGVSIWMVCDRFVYHRLHACVCVEADEDTPAFARGSGKPGGVKARPFTEWLPAWIGREFLALPIWTWAVLLGTTVKWRGKRFRVNRDMSVIVIDDKGQAKQANGDALPTDGSTAAGGNGHASDREHPTTKNVATWEGRPSARRRATRPKAEL